MSTVRKQIADFLRGKKNVLAVVGDVGSGKKHATPQAVQGVAGMRMVTHDHALHPVDFRRLGACLLGDDACLLAVNVVCGADSMSDYTWMGKMAGKVILVSHDASKALRESGVPIVRVTKMPAEAMTKYLFHELNWPAEDALRAARVAGGDWHQLRAQQQFETTAGGEPEQSKPRHVCSAKDERLAEPPCLIANRLLNGTAPETCPLDATTMAWVERNLPTHSEDDLEVLAQKQELLAVSADGFVVGCPASEELFKCVAGFRSKRVHYRSGLYRSPWEKDDAAVRDISSSFKKQRTSFSDGLKERARLEEAANASECCGVARGGSAAKSRAKPKRKSNSKSAPKPKQISSQSYATPHKKAGNEKCAG